MHLGAPEILLILIVVFLAGLIFVVPYWKIFAKAGFSPTLSLLMFVPLVNIGMLYFLAFTDWPALKQQQKQV